MPIPVFQDFKEWFAANGYLGAPTEDLVKAREDLARLKPHGKRARKVLLSTLRNLRRDDVYRDSLLKYFKLPSAEAAEIRILDGLAVLGPTEREIPEILSSLRVSSDEVAQHAVDALGQIASHPERVVPELVRILEKGSHSLQRCALKALAAYGREAHEAAPFVRSLLFDPFLARQAADCLPRIVTGDMDPVARAMIDLIGSDEPVSDERLRPHATELALSLEGFLLAGKSWQTQARTWAPEFWTGWVRVLTALVRMNARPSSAVRRFLEEFVGVPSSSLLTIVDPDSIQLVRDAQVASRKWLEAHPVEAGDLIADTAEPPLEIRRSAARQLVRMNADSPEAVQALARLLGRFDMGEFRLEIVEHLGRLGSRATPALEALRDLHRTASRPVTWADFAEQRAFAERVGDPSLLAPIARRIDEKVPFDPETAKAAVRAIAAIEAGVGEP